jgi:hypothetical protein
MHNCDLAASLKKFAFRALSQLLSCFALKISEQRKEIQKADM